MATPYDVVELPSTDSTQDEARHRFTARPVLVVADRQARGRGRAGSEWRNADRLLAASLALRVAWPSESWGRLPLVAGVAAVRALPGPVALKWPNDLLAHGGKAGGILVESDGDAVVVGIGANLWWPGSPPGATALFDADPGPMRGGELARRWAAEMLGLLAADAEAWPRDEYGAACETLGQEITWDGGDGRAVGVDSGGALLVETGEGTVALHSGEVRHVRLATLDVVERDDP